MSNSKSSDYREILKGEFARRSAKNAAYSQRAFARDLGILPHRLSQILAGKQGLSKVSARKVAERLDFSRAMQDTFVDMVVSQHGRSASEKEMARLRLLKTETNAAYSEIGLDQFKVISDWYHFAILELTRLKAFKSDPGWIAHTLAIDVGVAEEAVERLCRLGLLLKKNLKLVASDANTWLKGEVPSESIREFHRQIILNAARALDQQAIEQREFTSLFVTVAPEALPAAKQKIKEFWQDFCAEMNRYPSPSNVYCLSVQFFGVTHDADD